MKSIKRKVDQWIFIGNDIRVSPTDIDAESIRLIAHGRVMGGANDGEKFDSKHDLSIGQSCHFGPHVAVTVVEIKGNQVRLGVLAPSNVEVFVNDQAGRGTHGS